MIEISALGLVLPTLCINLVLVCLLVQFSDPSSSAFIPLPQPCFPNDLPSHYMQRSLLLAQGAAASVDLKREPPTSTSKSWGKGEQHSVASFHSHSQIWGGGNAPAGPNHRAGMGLVDSCYRQGSQVSQRTAAQQNPPCPAGL